MTRSVLAFDGGNSKTDVALLSGDGTLLSWIRGPGGALGPHRTAALVARLAAAAAYRAGLTPAALADAHGAFYLAGADLPPQIEALRDAITARGVTGTVEVGNDAWALLRTGASAATPAVAVVCGAGLKCVARAGPDRIEFPSLGWQTGDLSGAGDFLAREGVRAAARAEDGRGPATRLRQVVCEQLGVPSVRAVGERLVAGTLTERRLGVLAPAVLSCARTGDAVAASIVDDLAAEVATLARCARDKFLAVPGGWTLVLGGGLFADPAGRLLAAVRAAAPRLDGEFVVCPVTGPPVIGAALLGLDHLGVTGAGGAVLRAFRDATPQLVEDVEPGR
jgi:N-acetylglucosamine kinase-like BadF-type ATPase